jgi:hypothetical protein
MPVSRRAPKEVSVTRGRAAIAVVVVAVAMALGCAGISHTSQTKTSHLVADIRPRLHPSDNEEAGSEMPAF